eukprot:17044-Heterococcus_DN1.PRE.1
MYDALRNADLDVGSAQRPASVVQPLEQQCEQQWRPCAREIQMTPHDKADDVEDSNMLYYHKHSLTTVLPEDELQSSMPVNLSYRGVKVLGLPLTSVAMSTTEPPANTQLSYTLMSESMLAVDKLEMRWLQVLYIVAAAGNFICLFLLLATGSVDTDPTHVIKQSSGVPGAFTVTVIRNDTAHTLGHLAVQVVGLAAVVCRRVPLLSLYLSIIIFAFMVTAPVCPTVFFAWRYLCDVVCFSIAKALLRRVNITAAPSSFSGLARARRIDINTVT